MQFRTDVIVAVCVLALAVTAKAQVILYDGKLESVLNGGNAFRNDATNAGAAQVSDSTDWVSTSGWDRATIQHVGTDSYALDSVGYTLFARWSNDKVTPFISDSLPPEVTEGSANLDTLIIRSAKWIRICVLSHAAPGSPSAPANYSSVAITLVAKGRR